MFKPVKENEAEEAQAAEEAAEPVESGQPEEPVYEDIYSSSGKKARHVNIEEEEEAPISFTDDIDPDDFFASLKSQLRENFDESDESGEE